jgi:predicted permease
MDWIRILCSRIAALFRRRSLDADLDDELRAHLELAIAENMRRGLPAGEARAAALREFGQLTQMKERYRMQQGISPLEQTVRDLRFGFRQLRKSPGFALTAILTLALGLGANTAVFSLINALLLRPLPVPRADELTVVHYTQSDDPDPNYSFSAPMFRALERRHEVFDGIAAFTNRAMQVRGASGSVDIFGALVSGQFFDAMKVRPLLGRYLTPQDDRKGGTGAGFAVVISEGFWQTRFNRSPDVIGRQLAIANTPFTVVGVMPNGFIGADPTRRPELYVPVWAEPVIDAPYDSIAGGHNAWWMRVIARRKSGVTLEQANSALAAASNAVLDESSEGDATWLKEKRDHHFQLLAQGGSQGFSYVQLSFSKPLAVVFALCAAMLLLACLNLASLLMARSAARERELATRLALGATRRRLIGQLMMESVLIALLGTLAGILVAPVVSESLAVYVLGANNRAGVLDTALDLRAFLFIALIAAVTSLLIGLIPSLRATSKSLNEQIKSGAHTVSANEKRRVLPRVLMGFEVALALILVSGAGLLATSLLRLYHTGLGFDPRGLVNLGLDMNKQGLSGDALTRWYQSYGEALRHLPGVKDVSFAQQTPMDSSVWTSRYKTSLSGGDRDIYMNRVSPGFLSTLRIPLLAGRDFRWDDALASGRKIILSEKAAKILFPGVNPVGQHIRDDKDSIEVIGIAGDIHYRAIREEALAEGYSSITQNDDSKPSYTCVVRLDGSAEPLAAAARTLAAKTAPEIPAPVLITMTSQLDDSISSERMMALLAVFFAGCALLVTAIGLYGTLAYATARRTSEIGIRMALGARRLQVVALVFRENAWVAVCGSILGLVVALLASRALATFLYGISARDPWVMVGSVLMLLLVASAASLIPAVRAARIEPMTALRME